MGRRRPAPRLGREMKSALETVLQWRRGHEPTVEVLDENDERRKGILTPVAHQRGRHLRGVDLTVLQNPAYLLFTPSTNSDGTLLDIKAGDVFVRLKYYPQKDDESDSDYLNRMVDQRSQVLTVHSSEEKLGSLQILGELEP